MTAEDGTCAYCRARGPVYHTGRRWVCAACWRLFFNMAPPETGA